MRWRCALAAWAALVLSACRVEPDVRASVASFSGRGWRAKEYLAEAVQPGPNLYSASLENAWVDARGYLHLRITERGGRWYCAEIASDRSFGYGTYVFTLGSSGVALDPGAVAGFFSWVEATDASLVNSHREIDLEFSRWGNPAWVDFQYVVQPYTLSSDNVHRFEVDDSPDGPTVHAFTWSPAGVTFVSARGDAYPPPESAVIGRWDYAGPATPAAGQVQAHLNLWLVGGAPPGDRREQEIVVRRFEFIPP